MWFVFSSPYFLRGKVPYASTYQVNFFPPWSHLREFWGPIKNNAMPDVHTQIYPWKKFTIDTFRQGQVPLWNPYSFSGSPHLANFQSAILSPFNFLFFLPAGRQGVLPFIDAWSVVILLQPLMAGLFMYLFMRSLHVSQAGSLLSSITFMFCGFIIAWMAYGTLAYAILYLPLALYTIEKYLETKQLRFNILLSATLPLSFFSGHFQTSVYFFGGILLYLFFKSILTRDMRSTFSLLLSIALGLFLSLPQLLPSIALYLHSVRSELFLLGEGIPIQYLVTIIAPDFFGNPVTRNDWFGHYAEWASFVGILPFFLSLYAIVTRKTATIRFFSFLGIAALILAVRSPLSELIVALKIPVISTSALSRVIVLFSFSFAVLAGLGLEQLKKKLEDRRGSRTVVALLAVIGTCLIGIWVLIVFGNVYPKEWVIVAKRNLILPTVLFSGGAFLILASIRQKRMAQFTLYCFLFAISFDSLRFAQKWMPFDPRHLVYPKVAVIDGIAKHIGEGRIFGNIGGEVTTYYRFPSIEGYDPLYIARYGEFIRGATSGELLQAERSVVKVDRRGRYTDRALDLLGVSLFFHPIADTNQGWAYPVWEKKEQYDLVYKDDIFQLFRNKHALPRAALFYHFEVIPNDQEIIKRFYSEGFDFRNALILENDPNVKLTKGEGNTKIISYEPNNVRIVVSSTTPALLFLSDNFYPGWKVKVNGSEAKIYRADYTFRAVVVPAGKSVVEFNYEDWYF